MMKCLYFFLSTVLPAIVGTICMMFAFAAAAMLWEQGLSEDEEKAVRFILFVSTGGFVIWAYIILETAKRKQRRLLRKEQ